MTRRPGFSEQLSGAVGRLASTRVRGAAAAYAKLVGADPAEAELPVDRYESVLDFFTRRLKPGARSVDSDPGALVSAVDGRLLAEGPVGDGRLVQSKDRRYPLAALLEDDPLAARMGGGAYVTVYLSPRDYHRIHAPANGRIRSARVIPGTLWPVNDLGTRFKRELFVTNRRVVVELDSDRFGRVLVVMVGATNVGAIRTTFDPELTRDFAAARRRDYDPAPTVERGDEIGVFELGSTVIVVTEAPVRLIDRRPGDGVRMGQRLGMCPTPASTSA